MKDIKGISFKQLLLILTVFVSCNFIYSQNQFFGPRNKLTGGTVSSANTIRSSDLNNDSLPDVVCNSFNQVVWYKNMGEGKFDFQKTALTGRNGPSYQNIISVNADFDGDGDVDIAYYPTSNGELAWNENDGSASFDSIHPISNEFGFSSVSTSDFDNDGDMDLFVVAENTNQLILMLNDGIGNFSTPQILLDKDNGKWNTGSSDINGDENIDIIVSFKRYSDGEGEFFWIENEGDAIFGAQHLITENPVLLFHVSDMDGDDDPDLICAFGAGDGLKWLENDGFGVFALAHQVDTLNYSYSNLYTADFDNDGDHDILSSNSSSNGIFWYENSGSGSFGEMQIISNMQNSTSLFSDDLDDDGFEDLIAASHSQIVWHRNLKNDTFSDALFLTSTVTGLREITGTDLDHDGDDDIVTGGHDIIWLENLGNNQFSEPILIQDIFDEGGAGVMIDVVDIDNDMDYDIIFSSWLSGLWWIENNGQNIFDSVSKVESKDEMDDFCSGDMDNDEDIDLVSTSYFGYFYHENLGNGSFNDMVRIGGMGNYNNSVYLSDLDGDQKKDVIKGLYEADAVTYFKNYGAGVFEQYTIIDYLNTPKIVIAEDLNNDMKNDVIVVHADGIVYYPNIGNGLFGEQVIISESEQYWYRSLYIADIDLDGFQDIVYGTTEKLCWHQNLGTGLFGKERIIQENTSITSICAFDLDEDGDMEIFTAGGSSISWYENLLITTDQTENHEPRQSFDIYPNPATNSFTIQSSVFKHEESTVEIIDIYGRINQRIPLPKNQMNLTIDISHLQKGMYIVRITGNRPLNVNSRLIKN